MPVPPALGPPNDIFSGASIVNCTGAAAVDHATRFDRGGAATGFALLVSLDPDATQFRSRNRSRVF
jgi:hypothetical protein